MTTVSLSKPGPTKSNPVITAAVPRSTLLSIFSGLANGLSDAKLQPFIHNMHTALWVLAATSLVGALVSLLRPPHRPQYADAREPLLAAERVSA